MPGLRLKEVRLPELDLPEMSRDDIVRAINDTRRDVDLSRLDPRRLELPDVDLRKVDLSKVEIPKVELSKIDLSKVDLPKALVTAAQAAGIMRKRRSRLPFVVGGLITAAVVGFAVINSPLVKPRILRAAQRWRERMAARRGEPLDGMEPRESAAGADLPAAGAEPVGVPIMPTTYDIPPSPMAESGAIEAPTAPTPEASLETAEHPESAPI